MERPVTRSGEFDRRLWFQPLLLLGVVFFALPVTLRRTPPEDADRAITVLGLLAAASLAAWLVGRRVSRRGRRLLGWALVALGTVALLTVAHLVVPDRPEHAMPFAAGVAVSVAPVRRTWMRLPVQMIIVVGMGGLLLAAGRSAQDTLLAVFLLAFVVWLSGGLARSLLDARRAQRRSRLAAERRAELLAAVREFSSQSVGDAAKSVAQTLRSLGFTLAGVHLVRGGMLVPIAAEGERSTPTMRLDQGAGGACVTQDRTIVSQHYDRDPHRLPERGWVRSAIAVPIRVGGRPVGAVMAAHERAEQVSDADVEITEVLAAHLGGALETRERLDRQRELLERMQLLDDMRERLVAEVSEEVRDPLTVVRGIAETLVTHGQRLPDDRRARLLEAFEAQAQSLRSTIDALLDFSRLQAARPAPTLALTRIGDLLEPVLGAERIRGDLDAVVRTDPALLGRALEIVAGLGDVEFAEVRRTEEQLVVDFSAEMAGAASRSRLLLGLTERLLVAVGGTLHLGADGIELRLPRETVGAREVAS